MPVVAASLCIAFAPRAPAQSLSDLSLEDLGDVTITSVSRRAEHLGDAAASVYVITADAIRRSGASSLPEALRLAPNLEVAQVDAHEYAISARGFNNSIGNKLLVLVDGRTVYTPFFSGVFWDQQAVLLQDVDRIEVISGPGATLWGTNAVNGVINVITRTAAQTEGAYVSVEGASSGGVAGARVGLASPSGARFRVYALASHEDDTVTGKGMPADDAWSHHQVGFLAGWQSRGDTLTIQGDAYAGRGETRPALGLASAPVETSGANLLARLDRALDDGGTLHVQAYLDASRRDDPLLFRPHETTFDVEAQHGLVAGAHRVVWGAGYRHAWEEVGPGFFFGFVPSRQTLNWVNVFGQDSIAMGPRLEFTAGTKLEHDDFSGYQFLPSARLAWKPTEEALVWTAASRAVRAPAILDRDIRLPPTPPYIIAGGPGFGAEVAYVAELGTRAQLGRDASASLTLYQNWWERLRSGQPPPDAHVQNMISGTTHGAEVWVSWRVATWCRLSGGGNLLREHLSVDEGSTDPSGPRALGNDPRAQWQMHAALDLGATHELDVGVRHVAALPWPVVPAYTAVDARLAWRPSRHVSVALVARNLLDPSHAEYGQAPGRSELDRRIALRWEWTP